MEPTKESHFQEEARILFLSDEGSAKNLFFFDKTNSITFNDFPLMKRGIQKELFLTFSKSCYQVAWTSIQYDGLVAQAN